MNFKDIDIKISYLSTGEDSFSDILNPLLSYTKIYKRSVGFFSSSALNFIGDGILEMARKGGKIYLATSPQLTDEDICAIQSGYLDREKILRDKFLTEVQDTFLMLSDDNAKMLYSLVKEGIVDVKIVVRRNGMYHDKLAILEDFDGNVIACVGSNNETASGYNNNYEKTRVYKSWCDFEGRIQDETSEFNSIWEDNNSELIVFNFMDAFQKELLERVEKKGIYKPTTTKYKMRDYQIEAKEAWNKNHAGFFVMATGTGKTITALYSIKEFIASNKIFTVIAVPYKHLVAQWVEDVKVFFPDAYICIVHGEVKDGETKVYACYLQAQIDYKPIIVITTIKSFFLERYTRLYNNVNFEKLLVVDEAHNFINRISDDLDRTYRYKLGLSATPVFGNDENKTRSLLNWFGGQVVDLPIEKALGKTTVLGHYASELARNASHNNVGGLSIADIQDSLQDLYGAIDDMKAKRKEIMASMEQCNARRDEILKILGAAASRGNLEDLIKSKQAAIKTNDDSIHAIQHDIGNLFYSSYPYLLLAKDASKSSAVLRKKNVEYASNYQNVFENLKKDLLKEILAKDICVCGRSLDDESRKRISDIIDIMPPGSYIYEFGQFISKAKNRIKHAELQTIQYEDYEKTKYIIDLLKSNQAVSKTRLLLESKNITSLQAEELITSFVKLLEVKKPRVLFDFSSTQIERIIAQIYEKLDFDKMLIINNLSQLSKSLRITKNLRESLSFSSVEGYSDFLDTKEGYEKKITELTIETERKQYEIEHQKTVCENATRNYKKARENYELVLKSNSVNDLSERAAAAYTILLEKLISRQAKILQDEFIICFNAIINKDNFIDGIVIDGNINDWPL